MLIRDPYFQLYLLHVAALFVIALWPRISNSQAQQERPQAWQRHVPQPPGLPATPAGPGLVRHWSLGVRGVKVGRFQELESIWCAESASRFSQIIDNIALD